MDPQFNRAEQLLNKWLSRQINTAETEELFALLRANQDLADEILSPKFQDFPSGEALEKEERDQILAAIFSKSEQQPRSQPERVHRIHFMRRSLVRLAVAAVFLIAAVGAWLFIKRAADEQKVVAEVKDVAAPKVTKAMITLSDGRRVPVDSLQTVQQGNVTVIKNDKGEIVYSGVEETVAFNTLDNPRGSKVVTITLSDGTKVWLNTESSIKYPVAFVGKERRVEITGEAYFEVAKDAGKPFITETRQEDVQVLGTHFNIHAYADAGDVKTTLLEGSVRVSDKILRPGEQFEAGAVRKADIERVMAWKNGFFAFKNANIGEVMQQLKRWYDIDVRTEGKISSETFSGELDRNLSLMQSLKILESIGADFKLENGRTIVISKK